jgi:phage gp45-like
VLQVGGTADHRVALLPDGTGQRLSGLSPGEIGLADLAGNTVRVTAGGIALKHQASITIEAPAVKLGGPGAVLPVKLADNSAATKVFAQ